MTCLVVLFCVVMYSRKYKIIFELKETLVQFCLSVTQEREGPFHGSVACVTERGPELD